MADDVTAPVVEVPASAEATARQAAATIVVPPVDDSKAGKVIRKAGVVYRYFSIDHNEAVGLPQDGDVRRIPLSFSSEFPALQRCDGMTDAMRSAGIGDGQAYVEILSHDPDDVDLSLLNNSGAFLDEHDDKDHIGVVEKAEMDGVNRVGRAVVRLDNHAKGLMRADQMISGSRPHISAGYKHTKFIRKEAMPNGRPAYRFGWRALELSSVAVPADPTIGVARHYKEIPEIDSERSGISGDVRTKDLNPMPIELTAEEKAANEKAQQAAIDQAVGKAAEKARSETRIQIMEQQKVKRGEMIKISDELIKDFPHLKDNIRKMTDEAFSNDEDLGAFQVRAMRDVIKAKPITKSNTMTELGYDEQDRKRYSMLRGIQNVIKRGNKDNLAPDPDTLEGDVHAKMARRLTQANTPNIGMGFWVPFDENVHPKSVTRAQLGRIKRDLVATNFGEGGASVQTELLMPIIELLRNEEVCSRMGITTLSGLEGNIVIPRQTAAATAFAVPEVGGLTNSTQTLDQIALTPKRIGAYNQYSKQLLLQSSMDVENFIRTDLTIVLALFWDEMILNGQGGNSQPVGILNTPGVSQLIFGGAANWANAVLFETNIAKLNARKIGRGYVTTSNAKGRWKTLAKLLSGATTVAAVPLWEGTGPEGLGMGLINDYPALDSQQIPNDQMIFGVWPSVVRAMWGGLDVVVDPYSLATQGEVRITMNTYGDVALRHPQEFCVSLDSAAQ